MDTATEKTAILPPNQRRANPDDVLPRYLQRLENTLDIALRYNAALESKSREQLNQLEQKAAELSAHEATIEKLERDILMLRKELKNTNQKITEAKNKETRLAESKDRHIASLQKRNTSLKSSPTYQLGDAIISATKSVSGLKRLPKRLWEVHREGHRRHKLRKGVAEQ